MEKILIIPDRNDFEKTLSLQKEYDLGFEYNDFFMPCILDDGEKQEKIINDYKACDLPEYTTMHGAFFDVIPFSVDEKIKEISLLRINQSISVARKIGAKAVVFHTNYNPFLNSKAYVDSWIKQNAEIWKDILNKNNDINIYLENMFDETPDILCALAENLSECKNFGICLDWAHAAISKAEPTEWAKALGKYVKHVHINDNDLKSDLHLAWGDGKINRQAFYDCYEKYLNKATVLIETASFENKKKSLEQLKKDGVLK